MGKNEFMGKDNHAKPFHTLTSQQSLDLLATTPHGLSSREAAARLERYGKNELQESNRQTLLTMFIQQFKDLMIIILLVAAAIAGFTGELADTLIIVIVVLINALLGVAQESKAEKALAALKKMSSPYARVYRDNEVILLRNDELVPGDVVLVEAGDYIPADIRLLDLASLKVEEAALTGESVPVEKSTRVIPDQEVMLGDRANMAYLGTSVTYGRASGLVTATGMQTEVGTIATQINATTIEETPLQKKLAELGKYLTLAVVIIAVIIFIIGIYRERDTLEMFLIAISLAVAAIPEGLPAIVTIVLALGVQRMAERNSIIRRLSAVETLGSTEVICSDKTGTLTMNQMTVQEIFWSSQSARHDELLPPDQTLANLMMVMILCNDSKVAQIDGNTANVIGDPTETALIQYAMVKGYYQPGEMANMPRIAELPFDSERKLMTTVNNINGIDWMMTKGAPDVLLARCSQILIAGEAQSLDENHTATIRHANHNMAGRALRVIAMAYKEVVIEPDESITIDWEYDLTFLGMVGMIDPPRREARDAVRVCREAGIKPVMITGDHPDTAAAIAADLGFISDISEILTGTQLNRFSESDFNRQVGKYSVYARVSPEHKVRIVRAWKNSGKVVAMTGDGVNDAPALKSADIGIGMGITGTDVAKGVSDMVLADDNFATIVAAVAEGRKIYSNIRKAIQFLLSANTAEILTLLVATMLNWTILFPIHILWINLVTDTFPALALGVEKEEKDIMKQKPRDSSASIFAGGMGINILYQGLLQALITLWTYYLGIKWYQPSVAITMAFATLAFIQLAHALNVRSVADSIFKLGPFSNRYLLGAALLSGLLLAGVILIPGLNQLFRVTSLNLEQWAIVAGHSLLIIPLVELVKWGTRLAKRK